MSEYKDTLNLPETGFPMRGNLANREPEMLERWYKEDLYGEIRKAKKGKKSFVLHDGHLYATVGLGRRRRDGPPGMEDRR